jgi:sugar phosphate isomerase/epimerase
MMNPLSINFYLCPPDIGLARFCDLAARAGARAVGLTVRALEEMPLAQIRALLESHGLEVSSLNSAGYFLHGDAALAREQAARNERLIGAAAELGAQTLVVITGGIAHGALSLREARARVAEDLIHLADRAAREQVVLGLEPIHPAGILDKACVNTIGDALALANRHAQIGLTVDFFHTWWDAKFAEVFVEAPAKTRLVQFSNVVALAHPADFQRELPGAGLIDVAGALQGIRASGYGGHFEFEMFPAHLRGRSVEAVIEAAGRFHAALA